MFYANTDDGRKIEATPKARAVCPICEQEVIAKCGDIVTWHWAHKASDCDAWAEGETEWHLGWKRRFKNAEVTIRRDGEWHRADAMTDTGWIVEFQHSSISTETMRVRETFYRNMIWVFDVTSAREFDNFTDRRLLLYQVDDARGDSGYVTFRWKHPKAVIATATKAVYLDLGDEWLLRLGAMYPGGVCGGWGHLVSYQDFMKIDD